MLCVGGGLSTVRGCGCGHPFLQARGCRGVAPGDDGCCGERVGWRVRFRLSYSQSLEVLEVVVSLLLVSLPLGSGGPLWAAMRS